MPSETPSGSRVVRHAAIGDSPKAPLENAPLPSTGRLRRQLFAAILAVFSIASAAAILWPRNRIETTVGVAEGITETVAASGVVQGLREVSVGSSVQGTVVELFVRVGDRVKKGQVIAQIQDNVARAQIAEARASVQTARAGLLQAQTGNLRSEIVRARALLTAARFEERQAQAAFQRAQSMKDQAIAAVEEHKANVANAKNAIEVAEAKRSLAQLTFERLSKLYSAGAVAGARKDESQTALSVSQAERRAAEDGLVAAMAGLAQSKSVVKTAGQDIAIAARAMDMAKTRVSMAEAALSTVAASPRRVDVDLARARLVEAEASATTAERQAENTRIAAPFDGVVTQVLAERGANVGPVGIVRIVEAGRLEINLNLDETNLGDVAIGQRAEISYSAYPDQRVVARVTKVAPDVNQDRGTIKVTVIPGRPPAWLRPGQTVDVNVVTAERARRLLIPITAIHRSDSHTAVFVLERGAAALRPVVVGPAIGDLVPVLRGLSVSDRFVRDADGVTAGQRVESR